MPPVDPSGVIRQTNPATMRNKGRGGDSMMAHVAPGEVVVPPEVQTPEVTEMLNRAFLQVGANPTSYQVGHPNQKINPETGEPEFFLQMLLPMALGLAGSSILGPMIGTGLGIAADAGGLMGAVPGALGGAIGSTAGNLLTGQSPGQAITNGAFSAAGSAIGGGMFGSGATPAGNLDASDGIRNPAGMADLPGGGLSPTGWPLTTDAGAAGAAAAAKPSTLLDKLISGDISGLLGPGGIKGAIGSGIGGMIGGNIADSLFAQKVKAQASDDAGFGPSLPIGGGPSALSGSVNAGAPQFPGAEYMRNYGQRPAFNYFPT